MEDDGVIIGLRMFMFWEFVCDGNRQKIRAIRPVDKVVDKSYRGKGLFKELTLKGLEMCQGKFDLIFNTPNENSLKGYLKMGWNLLDKSPNIKIGVLNPFLKKYEVNEINLDSFSVSKNCTVSNLWYSNKTDEFIKWRYFDDQYKVVQFEDSILIYSTTQIKNFSMIIIFELLGDSQKFQGMVNGLGKKIKSFLVYHADTHEFKSLNFIGSITRKSSKIVFKNDQNAIQGKINFSLGDLEGKL